MDSFFRKFSPAALVFVLSVPGLGAESSLTLSSLKAVAPKAPEHPFLYFSKSDLPALQKKIKEDPGCAQMWERLNLEAKRYLVMPLPPEPARLDVGRFHTDGVYEGYHRLTSTAALTLSFMYAVTGEKKFLDKAWVFADAFCLLPTWVFRAHEFPVIEGRIWPWGVDATKDQVVFSFDHITGDAAREMAAVYDWLYPGLNRYQRNRIRSALLENAILRVRNAYEYQWWSSSYRCNWVGVCNSGLGLAALSLYTENPELLDVVFEAHQRIGKMLDQIGQDGEWQEGVSYWNYALRTSVFFMDALKRFTGGKVNLFGHPKLKNTFDFPLWTSFPGKKQANFGDAHEQGPPGSFSFYTKYSQEVKSPVAAYLAGACSDEEAGKADPFALLWNKSSVAPALPKPESKHFRTIDWLVLRTQWDDSASPVLAAKAGILDDPHHGHLDVGSFILNYKGENLIKDLGRPVYDEEVFDTARWTVPHCISAGHNVILVNGEGQVQGASYFGKVEKFTTSPSVDYVDMNLAKAYPGKQLKGWSRRIVFHKPGLFVIFDEVRCASGSLIEARFHPGGELKAEGNAAVIQGAKGSLAVAPIYPGEATLLKGVHPYLPIQRDAKMQDLPYFDIEVTGKGEVTQLLTVVAPLDSAKALGELRKNSSASLSGNTLSYRVDYRGKTYAGHFTLSPKGADFKEGGN